jgi:hypothetical protein
LGIQARKLSACAASVALFAVTLLVVYGLHARFFAVEVVFYSALLDAGVACIFVSMIWFTRPFSVLDLTERALLFAVLALGGYSFAISVPTVIDRSLSFYLLEKLNQRGGGIREDAIERIIATEYLREFRVADARLTEQLESGTIRIINGCVLLTTNGKLLAGLSQSFRENFLPKQRLISGQYTDSLTTPFDDSPTTVDYACDKHATSQAPLPEGTSTSP